MPGKTELSGDGRLTGIHIYVDGTPLPYKPKYGIF
jgi:hypothetical protein